MAIFFTRLPDWTTWLILAIVAIYDLFAVLCPRGPLKILVETAQKRQEPIPALLYSASAFIFMAKPDSLEEELSERHTSNKNETQHSPAATNTDTEEEEEQGRGVKLGLGDFVFYSVLIGRAALFDMITVFACFIAIITGLFLTLLLLAIFRKALPALPISIALGILFYFLTRIFLQPFIITLAKLQLMV